MTHFCELFTSQTIRTLRGASFEQDAVNNEHLSPEIYFSWDDEEADVRVALTSQLNTLLDMAIEVTGQPRWLSLNVGLGWGNFLPGDCIGLILELEMAPPFIIAPFIRSAREQGYADTNLPPQSPASSERQVLTMLKIVKDEDAVLTDGFHTLVIPLPAEAQNWKLHDLRLISVPKEQVDAALYA